MLKNLFSSALSANQLLVYLKDMTTPSRLGIFAFFFFAFSFAFFAFFRFRGSFLFVPALRGFPIRLLVAVGPSPRRTVPR